MDVVCGRCRAEYEFDDALISERGTTVRCTNCGLQFKVFPPVGQRAPEVWRVFDPANRQTEAVEYPSLRELQKAIARGDVRGDHLLSRGGDEPRPLAEIVELQPLLQQPRSEPPPPMPSSGDFEVPGPPPTGAAPSSTVMGVAQRPDPAAVKASRMAPAPPVTRGPEDNHAPVQSAPMQEAPAPSVAGEVRESKPKIRSALSLNPPVTQGGAEESARPSEPPPSKSPSLSPPRQSLRSTLSGSFPTPSQAAVPPSQSPVDQATAAPAPEHEPAPAPAPVPPAVTEATLASEGNQPAPAPQAGSAEPRSGSAGPEPAPAGQEQAAPTSRTEGAAAQITAPVEPEITDSGEFPGQMTPTPSGMRAYRTADSEPVSSVAGVPVKRQARSGGIVLAVLVGGLAFLGFANRDRISGLLAQEEQSATNEETKPVEVSADVKLRLEMVDVSWVSENLFETPDSEFEGGPREAELSAIRGDLAKNSASVSWQMVNLHRASGKFGEARQLAGKLKDGAEQSYALALLDLAEGGDKPPWPVIIERLKAASTGERGRFLARTVYIYALAASGEVARARADFEALSKIAGAPEAPLYKELEMFLKGQDGAEASDEPEADESPAEETAPESAPEAEEPEAEPEPEPKSEPRQKAAEPDKKPEPAPAPKPAKVSAAIKAKVEQADAMWRGGNQDGALAIYRQVVAEIGTKHFLGQRSAARIRQAQRERSGEQ